MEKVLILSGIEYRRNGKAWKLKQNKGLAYGQCATKLGKGKYVTLKGK